jgi:hypothetical protein
VTSLALVIASTILAAVLCLLFIGLGSWLFWKLVRVMGRIQTGERLGEGESGGTDRVERRARRPGTTGHDEPLR